MNDLILHKVVTATARSELLRAVASVRSDGGHALALGPNRLRPLSTDEILRLENLGNMADDWSRVRVADGFDWRRVRQCSFSGDVVLGRMARQVIVAPGVELPSGIFRSTLVNCIVGNDALVRDVKLLANYVVGPDTILLDCGCLSCAGPTSFGNGQAIPVGIECGGREVLAFAEIDVEVAAAVARRRSRHEFLKEYARLLADYTQRATCQRGIIERGATVRSVPTLRDTYLGPYAVLDGATRVEESTLLSRAEEPVRIESGACVSRSLLQWGSGARTMAIVERSVLTEHAHAERHGKVSTSIVGPNTVVGEGEVTACLLGPFVGFHHQALLIAALWPEGKGNVSYGANVGSNHTSKAPDQEFWPGEGAFLGLGVNIKYPSDFSQAPYTVVASGVSTLPQKLQFPFSLVNAPAVQVPGVSPALNEIFPAWLLANNLYTIKRNEAKYQARNRARRTAFTFAALRPDTVDLMRDACRRLEAVPQTREFYTERDIEGLGKNFLLESSRVAAVATYRFHIRYYALLGLLERVKSLVGVGRADAVSGVLVTPGAEQPWEHQRRLLAEDGDLHDAAAGLRELLPMLEEVAWAVERSKAKDDERGPRIIDDYRDVHVPAAEDPFVRQTWVETRRLQTEVNELLALKTTSSAVRAVG